MNPAPGTSWPDLHYADDEQVELDVQAIIARGTRLRRRRLITKVAAAAVVVGIGPVAVVVDISRSVPHVQSGPIAGVEGRPMPPRGVDNGPGAGINAPAAGRHNKAGTVFRADNGTARKVVAPPNDSGSAGDDLMFSLAQATVRRGATLSHGYGSLLAIAGARAATGVWFAATAAQLTLFRLSTSGALASWPLPTPASSVRSSSGVGMAVTTAGVAWIGVGSTLLRLNTKNSQLSSWQVPTRRAGRDSKADSVAISPDGHVAVAMSYSSSVQVLDPRRGTFRRIKLPDAADRPLAVGYARNGTLGIGYEHPGRAHSGAVLLVNRTGVKRSVSVPQPTAIAEYGGSGLLVGVTELTVVPERGHARPLGLPANPPDFAGVTTAPAGLPGNRLAIAMDTAILTLPATTSVAEATAESELWVTPSPRCRPHHRCPAGYESLTTDSDGNVWAVPRADPRTVELISLR